MALPPTPVQDRFRAAVLGMAVGDALGFPLRGIPASNLARLPGLAEDFAPRPRGGRFAKGQFSDDTQLMLATAESVVLERRINGRSVAAHYAWLWHEGVLLQPPRLAAAIEQLGRGVPWMSAGAPLGVKDPSSLSRALVVGLWNVDTPARIPHEAGVLSVITHKDPACAAAAAAYAQAVCLGLAPERLSTSAFCEALAVASGVHDAALARELRALPRLLTWEPEEAVERLQRTSDARASREDGTPAHPVPVLLIALYAALRVPHDFREALKLVLRAGGEVDAAAALCGGLLGAHLGEEAIPARLRRNVLYRDHLRQVADRLWRAKQPVETALALVTSRRHS